MESVTHEWKGGWNKTINAISDVYFANPIWDVFHVQKWQGIGNDRVPMCSLFTSMKQGLYSVINF